MTSVRPAAQSDVDAVAALEARVFADVAWSPLAVEEEFAGLGATRRILVAADGDRVVGYAVVLAVGEVADLTRIAVDGGCRRAGVGSQLIAAAVHEARRAGARRVMLEVAATNAAAVSLYERHGFEAIDRRTAYYADGSDAVVMSRAVQEAAR
jgi:ribosomal-protein-alanine N-acetyltransferase